MDAQLAREGTQVRRWLLLAAGSLLLAGFFAAFLVVGRAPLFGALTADPLFFRRCLVVHVDLSLGVWFYAFVAALFRLLPSRGAPGLLSRLSPWVAAVGVLLLMLAAGIRDAAPVLSNYIPMIDHPLFAAGLIVFAAGVAMSFFDGRLLPHPGARRGLIELPEAAASGLRAAAVAFLFALLTFGAAWLVTPGHLSREAYYENLFWGGGHVLQFASVLTMMAVWLVLLTPVLGRSPVGGRAGAVLFGLMLLPLLAAPLWTMQGTSTLEYRQGFTRLMQWGIFPVVSVVIVACVWALVRARRNGTLRLPLYDVRVLGFATSVVLTIAGFILGALIRGSNTMVPAHYHAAIGAVTVSFMAAAFVLLAPLGMPLRTARGQALSRLQPLLFGAGQLLFALGFGLAGAHGMGRKLYGAEQHIRTAAEWAGLALMGVGGLVAMVSGVLFLSLLALAWRRRAALTVSPSGRTNEWPTNNASIPSRS